MKDKKDKIVLNTFIKIVNESNRKPNKLWVRQGRDFYNKLMQDRLDDKDILMYLTHNQDKSITAGRFIRTLMRKLHKRMTAYDSKSYLSYLNKLVDQYNNTYYCSIGKSILMLIILL